MAYVDSADLAGTGSGQGAAMVGYSQAGTGASAQTVEGRLRKVLLVTDFGTVQQAVDALGDNGDLIFPPQTYTLSAPVTFSNLDDIRLVGFGAKITAATVIDPGYFVFNGCSRVYVEGFEFDQAKTALPAYDDFADGVLNGGLYFDAVSDISVERCHFHNLYTSAIYVYACAGLISIADNTFTSPTQTQNQWMSHVHIQTCAGNVTVERNRFVNAAPASTAVVPSGVTLSGGTGAFHARNNFFNYCGRDNTGTHRLGCIDVYGDALNVTIEDNISINCMAVWARVNAVRNAQIKGNYVHRNILAESAGNILELTGSVDFAGQKGFDTAFVSDNWFYDEGATAATAILVQSYDWGRPTKDVLIRDNKFQSCRTAVWTNGPCQGLKVIGNIVRSGRTLFRMENGSGLTSVLGGEAASFYDGIEIRDNELLDPSGANPNAIYIYLPNVTTAFVGRFVVANNRLRASPASAAAAILAIIDSSAPANTRLEVRENEISGYATAVDARELGELVVSGNRATGHSSFLTTTNVTTTNRRGNRLTSGPTSGRATLVGGTVTVNTAEVGAGDNIMLNRVVGAGTRGELEIGTITAGTSFVIKAVDAAGALVADTSTVFWEIVH